MLHFTRKERWHDNARLIIEETDLLCSQKPEGYQIAVRGNLLRLFYLIVSRTVRTPGKLRPGRLEKVKRIVKYVEDHFAEPISIHDMAKLSGYSESHFMKFFRDTMGMSFVSWLERYRLSMAARMLTLTDDPILLVSANAGYPSGQHYMVFAARTLPQGPHRADCTMRTVPPHQKTGRASAPGLSCPQVISWLYTSLRLIPLSRATAFIASFLSMPWLTYF